METEGLRKRFHLTIYHSTSHSRLFLSPASAESRLGRLVAAVCYVPSSISHLPGP